MNLLRIRKEFDAAVRQFSYVELYPTLDGKLYVKAALQASEQYYIVEIHFPPTYPNVMPDVHVVKPGFNSSPPHYY